MQIGADLVEDHLIELAGLEPGRFRGPTQTPVLIGEFQRPPEALADGSVLAINQQAAAANDQEEQRQHRHRDEENDADRLTPGGR
ncbi:hypothetical protein D3C80_1995980 [compost metagenome]